MHMALIDDIEHLAGRMNALREAEELAVQANRKMLPDLRKLHYASLREFSTKVRKLLRSRVASGTKPWV